MIYLKDESRKTVFVMQTNDQAACEHFIMMLGANYHGKRNSITFTYTAVNEGWNFTTVKVKVTKKHYKFELGTHLTNVDWRK